MGISNVQQWHDNLSGSGFAFERFSRKKIYLSILKNRIFSKIIMWHEYRSIFSEIVSILHPRLGFVVGDTSGHDDMVCHYHSYSSNICRMVRDCDIP